MHHKTEGKGKGGIFTVPNILSLLRILLIPVIIWLYCAKREYRRAFGALLLSGVTDLADGFIARHFDMVSPLGKALDPVADKLTQAAALLCLSTRFPQMLLIAGALLVKEIITGTMSLTVIRRTGQVKSADWHGKIVTFLLYFTMLAHMLWPDTPRAATSALTALCLGAMALSFALYFCRNMSLLRGAGRKDG